MREIIERVRAERRELGVDPIFAPKPKMIDGCLGDADDPNLSVAEWLDIVRGKRGLEEYETIEVDYDMGGQQGKN